MNRADVKIYVKDITLVGVMLALLEVVKQALVFIPNVELVSLLVIIFTLYFGKRTIFATLAFTCVEIFIWGVHTWVIMYIYIWPVLVFATIIAGKYRTHDKKDALRFAILSGIYGLLFGAMCSIVYIPLSGFKGAVAWWISGIPMDIVHGVSNFILCFVLFLPLDNMFGRLADRYYNKS